MPTLRQTIFANDWPMFAFIWLFTLFLVTYTTVVFVPLIVQWPWGILPYLGTLVAAALLGFIGGPFLGFIFLDGLYNWHAKRNGAPFHVGDRVEILAGKHRGRVTEVYEVWESRNQVRVVLSDADHALAAQRQSPANVRERTLMWVRSSCHNYAARRRPVPHRCPVGPGLPGHGLAKASARVGVSDAHTGELQRHAR